MSYLIEITTFIFGLCIGSFLNVCIFRLPAGKSIVHPPSACPGCGVSIRFYDNIPVLSYIFLRGRCRNCSAPIAFRYVLVELLAGALAVCTYIRFDLSIEGAIYYAFIAALLVITFIDIDHRIIPDIISLSGIPLGLAASFFIPSLRPVDSIIGLLAGGGILYAVAWGYGLITGKEGMGGGDIKLLAMIGAFIGWKGVLLTIFMASAIGTLAGVLVMLKTKKNMKLAIPFGPFLAIGAIIYIFFGNELIIWYWNVI
ncbi:MAG: prepilin peptidase [Deltaproteobacteria bacterium]|nr:prepilin peptidase [Deltaproteobacteria bacterium]